MRRHIICAGWLCVCGCVAQEVGTTEQEAVVAQGWSMQGWSMQGETLHGSSLEGATMRGFRFTGATHTGAALSNVRVERGELVAVRGSVTLRGTQLAGARLVAEVAGAAGTAEVTYRIAGVAPELAAYDPTHTGSTYLYTLEQWVDDTGSWQPACAPDADGRSAAVPLAATWDDTGARVQGTGLFTFGCTAGVIAKCYRWGYRPWVTGYGDLVAMHQACTRMARADYCGDGMPHTNDGTLINIWDTLGAPGPIQVRAPTKSGVRFEGAWTPDGAACLDHLRWPLFGNTPAPLCPDQPIPRCSSMTEALAIDPTAKLFDESQVGAPLP